MGTNEVNLCDAALSMNNSTCYTWKLPTTTTVWSDGHWPGLEQLGIKGLTILQTNYFIQCVVWTFLTGQDLKNFTKGDNGTHMKSGGNNSLKNEKRVQTFTVTKFVGHSSPILSSETWWLLAIFYFSLPGFSCQMELAALPVHILKCPWALNPKLAVGYCVQ